MRAAQLLLGHGELYSCAYGPAQLSRVQTFGWVRWYPGNAPLLWAAEGDSLHGQKATPYMGIEEELPCFGKTMCVADACARSVTASKIACTPRDQLLQSRLLEEICLTTEVSSVS